MEPAQNNGLNSLEQMGALAARLVHELTNKFAIVVGNLQLLGRAAGDSGKQADLLRRLNEDLASAGQFVDQIASFRRSLRPEAGSCSAVRLAETLKLASESAGWPVEIPTPLKGRLACEPRCYSGIIAQMAAILAPVQGVIRLHEAPPPARNLVNGPASPALHTTSLALHTSLIWKNELALLSPSEVRKPADLRLAIVYGIIVHSEGWSHFRFNPPDENQFAFGLPLLEA